MSEGLNRENPLYDYLKALYEGNRSREGYDQYSSLLETATPWQVNMAIDALLRDSSDFSRIENTVARFIRACSKGLDAQPPVLVEKDHFLAHLLEENQALTAHKNSLSSLFKDFSTSFTSTGPNADCRDRLLEELRALAEINIHYQKIEYPLSSALEDCLSEYRCTKLMWHIHDIVITGLKQLILELELSTRAERDWKEFKRVFGDVFLKLSAMIYRERYILFPVALRAIPQERFMKMNQELHDFGSSFGVAIPEGTIRDTTVVKADDKPQSTDTQDGDSVDLSVGKLLPSQIDLMLKNLPLDITYVDEEDRVRYYSQGKERIFPRSPGIIGRDVQNCHPPSSVHVVQNIVDDFKARRRDSAEFWIQMKGQFIHIRYFPLFEGDTYKGVIEVSQDIAPLRALEGEKRLLDEDSL
ncbi:DUF438 domain-containing protein [Oceanispirochaeta crateris]|uniref:DUF438 domain-containing protein n=1 Tax=Oceanispirochaeta crateris TaxID=2518645 RepID=A0A5C1QIW4_9SPIO|nr:PAS domain-containing protein [Oceanispirochaeta crateris]QEN06494.1 DUF438 domain-containing protein [Oceanispirochaeta crateris]